MSLSKKKTALWSAAAFGALVLIAGCGTEEGGTPAAAEQATTVTVTETEVVTETEAAPPAEAQTETKPAPKPKPKPKPKPELTVAQENAIESARSYLDFAGFSRKGLIDQLVYEGYSKKDATIAVDRIKPNWGKEAVQSAESYLEFSSFSRSGLIEQLEYEGFTPGEAAFAANKVGL
jgi:pyruvate/2-oxoglutarate dehydrogenase complex dihydrolipoamide acyltransferase (E2) component